MKTLSTALLATSLLASSIASAQTTSASGAFRSAPCETGIFRTDKATFVALTKADRGFSYTFSDGVVGNTQDVGARVACGQGAVLVGAKEIWPRVAVVESNAQFESSGVMLAGRLMEPPGAGKNTPLVVYAHGSEAGGWIDRARDPYQMLGRGVSVFVYDKRGTGLSKGEYTQNFPRLADDLVAASDEAKRLAAGRYGRFGLVGLSQGGWIVPLAAGRAKAQFLGIGYGLAVDIAEEDGAQVVKELRERGYGDDIIAKARLVTDITARIVKSGYKDGLDDLAAMQDRYGKEAWFLVIKGAYTGVLLGMPVDSLRKNGVPQFDKWAVDWSQNPVEVLKTIDVPQLWVFAEEDRQAPIALTIERLSNLRKQGKTISMYVFPDTEHGMWNYEQAADFSRKHTRVAAGFYDLMTDWAKGNLDGKYGKADRR